MRQVRENGKVNLVGQQHVIQLIVNPREQRMIELMSEEREIDVRSSSIVSPGARGIGFRWGSWVGRWDHAEAPRSRLALRSFFRERTEPHPRDTL